MPAYIPMHIYMFIFRKLSQLQMTLYTMYIYIYVCTHIFLCRDDTTKGSSWRNHCIISILCSNRISQSPLSHWPSIDLLFQDAKITHSCGMWCRCFYIMVFSPCKSLHVVLCKPHKEKYNSITKVCGYHRSIANIWQPPCRWNVFFFLSGP